MKKNTVIIAAVAAVFVFLLLAIGTLSFTLISNNQKTAAAGENGTASISSFLDACIHWLGRCAVVAPGSCGRSPAFEESAAGGCV